MQNSQYLNVNKIISLVGEDIYNSIKTFTRTGHVTRAKQEK